MMHDGKINMDGLLNDQIWTLFSKVPILVIFCWKLILYFPNMYDEEFSRWATFHMDFID
jgi:hypothetical protein